METVMHFIEDSLMNKTS